MGRHNHENSIPIPGYDDLVVLSGDDTFTSGSLTIPPGGPLPAGTNAAQSQVYSYIASDTDALLADEGDLWAFVSDNPSFNDYYDFVPGSAVSVSGHFVKVPKNIATGLNPNGSEIKAANAGFPLPPQMGRGNAICARQHRPALTVLNGCWSIGAPSTMSSSLSASKISLTINDPAWATWSIL